MSGREEHLDGSAGAGIFFASCGMMSAAGGHLQSGGPAVKRREVTVSGRRVRTIDVHAHCVVDIRELVKAHYEANPPKPNASGGFVPDPFVDMKRPMFMHASSVEARLRYMDENGIDMQAVSLLPGYNYSYWADRDEAAKIVRCQNEGIAELCANHPNRFVGLGAAAIQHPDLAAEQMQHGVKKLGLRGFEIGGSINSEELSAAKFDPFWAKAEELGTIIFIHPDSFNAGAGRFRGNGVLDNVIGNPLETTVALSHLIFEGTLDRYPGVKILAAHGGGFLGSYVGRSDHVAEVSPFCKPVKKPPSEYFKQQIYCDSLVFTGEGVRHLAAQFGSDRIMLGTDYPASMSSNRMGDGRGVDTILGAPGLSDNDKAAILGDNAAKVLGVRS
ncbi:MAG: amidohydrolase family protein [Candidatus Korobacteraceae bacterium]